jgi:hypothetical protein
VLDDGSRGPARLFPQLPSDIPHDHLFSPRD